MKNTSQRLEQVALLIVSALLALGCLLVLRPFVSAVLWALILALATWPALLWFERRLKHRRGAAALLLTSLLLLACVLPLTLVSWNLADNVTSLFGSVRELAEKGPPEAPAWLARVPLAGDALTLRWNELVKDQPRLLAGVRQLASPTKDALLAGGTFLGQAIFHSLLSLFLLFFIYRDGEAIFRRIQIGASKIAGDRSRRLLTIAGNTLQSAIYGIVGTAFAQGILAGLGFLIAGVPAPFLLAVFTFVLSPIPVGPPLVWVSAAIWLFSHGSIGWGIFMLLWGALLVSSVDNFLKPYLISRGSDLPLVLILLGVLGGALTFGALGVFLGPALLAVGYTVLKEWSETQPSEATPENPGAV